VTKPGIAAWNAVRRDAAKCKYGKALFTDQMFGGPVSLSSMLSEQPESERDWFYDRAKDPVADARPRWADSWFFSRPNFENLRVPDYSILQSEDEADMLPAYASRAFIESTVLARGEETISQP